MNKETIFFMILAMWYFNRFSIAKYLCLVYRNLYLNSKDFISLWRLITVGDLDSESESDYTSDVDNKEFRVEKELPRYEDKFLFCYLWEELLILLLLLSHFFKIIKNTRL